MNDSRIGDEQSAGGRGGGNNKSNNDSNSISNSHHDGDILKGTNSNTSTSKGGRRKRNDLMQYDGLWSTVSFLLGISRSPRQRTIYNASRPFDVLGGVSDREVDLLQQARGPQAQLALCTLWLREYIGREHLGGSTGGIAPPLVTRVYQNLAEGQNRYNQCRKVAYIQFPFPHAQLTTFFLLVSLFVFPLLYYAYVSDAVVACLLNFTTVACFQGIHEVARELEDPFYQFPNDLPLNHYQALFNESLISCLYAGFHPDVWGWASSSSSSSSEPAGATNGTASDGNDENSNNNP